MDLFYCRTSNSSWFSVIILETIIQQGRQRNLLCCGSRSRHIKAHNIYCLGLYDKNKPTGSSSANVQAPASTSETSTTIPVDNPTVPQAAANINAEGVETRLSQTVETVRDAGITPDAVKQAINENIENGGYRYIPESTADAAASVRSAIAENGYESVLRDWTADVRKITDAL